MNVEDLLTRAEANLVARRRADAEQLVLARAWALAHQRPADDHFGGVAPHVRLLGASAMPVWEYAPAELALVWGTHPLNAQRVMADAIDLHDRMPHAWEATMAGDLPAWVARRLVGLTRDLEADLARRVDDEISGDYDCLSPGRLLSVAAGRVAAAGPAQLDERAARARRQHLVHVSRPVDGSAALFARGDARDLARLLATCDSIADLLEEHSTGEEQETRGQLQARALGLLADPRAALDLLQGRDPRRGRAVVYVHVTPSFLRGHGGAARVEELGPHTGEMVRRLLGHDHVSVRPVIDLAEEAASDAYEVPAGIAERVHLIKPADVFPWAESTGRRVDLDHTLHWPHGPTTPGNIGKLVRRHHRIKTYAVGWTVKQLPGHRYLWRSPHGRYAVVDRQGTHRVDRPELTGPELRLLELAAT